MSNHETSRRSHVRARRLLFLLLLLLVGSPVDAAAPYGQWWDPLPGPPAYEYQNRKKITVNTGSAVAVGHTVSFTLDTANLISTSQLRADGKDWRVVWWNSGGSSWVELDRHVQFGTWNTATTKTWFKVQAAIPAASSDDNYYVYFNYAAEAGSPPATLWNVYNPPRDANTEVLWYAKDGTGPTLTDSGPNVRNRALPAGWGWSSSSKFGTGFTMPKEEPSTKRIGSGFTPNVNTQDWTVEMWLNITDNNFVSSGDAMFWHTFRWGGFTQGVFWATNTQMWAEINAVPIACRCDTTTTVNQGTTYHLAVTYEASTDLLRFYRNGTLVGTSPARIATAAAEMQYGSSDAGTITLGATQEGLRVSNVRRTSFPYVVANEPTTGVSATDVPPVGSAISSSFNQLFTVGGPLLPAATITITDDPSTATITAANDLRIRIPLGFPMRFDSAQTMLFIGGPASIRVANMVAYEDSGRTVVLDVLTDFAPSDQITVDFLKFWSFTAPAPADNLELEVGNDDVVSATDDKTITIVPDTFATLSSNDHQVFTQFQPPTPALPFTVSEGTTPTIVPGTDIRIRIPVGFNMTWDTGGLISFSGPAASRVSLPVSYEDAFRTLRIPVTSSFMPGDYVTVSGARFQGFFGISPANNLLLDVGASTDFDDKTIEIAAASDVAFFTATARDQAVKLEWLRPASGFCDNVLLLRRDDGIEPMGPTDPSADLVDFRTCIPLGAKDTVDDPLPLLNGTLYAYAAFVEYSGGTYTDGAFVKARPMDTVGTPVQWAYSTGATAMAPAGLRFNAGESYVYAVSNDSILHSMKGGSTGGDWPAGWKPYKLGGPAQARPPVVSFAVGSALLGAAFLGAQDGNVYAVDALDGSEEWKRSISTMVQAAPAGHFLAFYPGAFDIVIVGTRDSSFPNKLVALNVHTGNPVWSFTNSPAQLGDGKEIGIISGSASIDYPNKRAFFASHTRGGAMGSNRTLWCVDFSSGSPVLRWSLALGNIEGSPVLWNNAVYVGTTSGVLYAVDRYALTGTVNWSRAIGDGPIKGFVFPQIGTNRVLVSTTSKVTSTEDVGLTYNPVWQLTSTDIPGPSTPVFVPGSGKILVGSSDGHLYQMDAFTPLPTTRVQLGDGSSAVGVPGVDIVKSMIYVGSDEGVIYGVTFPIP